MTHPVTRSPHGVPRDLGARYRIKIKILLRGIQCEIIEQCPKAVDAEEDKNERNINIYNDCLTDVFLLYCMN